MPKLFSHIYIEEGVENEPLAKEVLRKFKDSELISIRHYKEFFSRPKQNWKKQKESMKLILARKTGTFLYQGPEVAPSFGHQRFRYTTPLINCLYDCEYCFLQGMFSSANVVLFVNQEDFFDSIEKDIAAQGSLYLCNSYETDLLGFEGIAPVSRRWIEFASKTKDLLLEIRTKSANFNSLKDLDPCDQVILAWTLSPKEIASSVEHKTPSLGARIASVKAAVEKGWKVRICVDPLLLVEDWEEIYRRFIGEIFSEVDGTKLYDIYLGSFRVNKDYLKKMRSSKPNSQILHHQFSENGGIVSYDGEMDERLKCHVYSEIVKVIPKEKVLTI